MHINENFAKLSEALFIADRKAREAVEMRSQLEKRLAQKRKEEQVMSEVMVTIDKRNICRKSKCAKWRAGRVKSVMAYVRR